MAATPPEPLPTPLSSAPTGSFGDDTLAPQDLGSASRRLDPGTRVDGYEVRRFIAEGGFGQVYLARDVALGRFVALKVARQEHLSPEREAELAREAKVTAQLSHPNILTVLGLGRANGRPYVALEYLAGESLEQRLRAERLPVREVMGLARDLCDALAAAHAAGIIHRDIKPANLIVPADGRLRVVDFGLATALTGWDGRIAGTRGYLAPECLRGSPPSTKADIFSVGMTLTRLLLGPEWEADPTDTAEAFAERVALRLSAEGSVPKGARDLVVRCLRVLPDQRPTAGELVEAFEDLVERRRRTVDGAPFLGLSAFDEQQSSLFFGREAELAAAAERLRHTSFLLIAGASGVGKSSFVRAGLIPALRLRGELELLTFRPGRVPLRELALRLTGFGSASGEPVPRETGGSQRAASLESELRALPWAAGRRLHELARQTGRRVVLLVDQLEEAFGGDAAAEGPILLRSLLQAASEPLGPVLVITTVRDDCLSRLLAQPEASDVLSNALILLPPSRDALLAIVTRPVERQGYAYEDDLAQRMVSAVDGAPAALPLLQFVGQLLWAERDAARRVLTSAVYERLGGVEGALARYAERVLAAMPPSDQLVARALCLRLVAPDGTRRMVDRVGLLDGLEERGERVLEALITSRLLTVRRAAASQEVMAELSHESLARSWPSLSRWLLESREDHALLSVVEARLSLWQENGRADHDLWVAPEVLAAHQRLTRPEVVLTDAVRQFLQVSAGAQLGRQRRRRRLTLGAIATLAVIAVAASLLALRFREQEATAREQAERIDLARADIGRATLELVPYGWSTTGTFHTRHLDAAALPLELALYRPSAQEPWRPAEAIPSDLWSVVTAERGPIRRVEVTAPGGALIISVTGRGGACGPSWLRVAGFPGYAGRDGQTTIRLEVPACEITEGTALPVSGGAFAAEGPGVPAATHDEYVQPEETVVIPAFYLDATEVPRELFDRFRGLAAVTGLSAPDLPGTDGLASLREPDAPATGLTADLADAFCRYLGGRVPSSVEWEKAARGGADLGGRPNPFPRRGYPWGDGRVPVSCANLAGDADGYPVVAPVTAFPECAGPYGHLGLAGNVWEWTSTAGAGSSSMRLARGGAWTSEAALDEAHLAYVNTLNRAYFTFAYGVRCAYDAVPEAPARAAPTVRASEVRRLIVEGKSHGPGTYPENVELSMQSTWLRIRETEILELDGTLMANTSSRRLALERVTLLGHGNPGQFNLGGDTALSGTATVEDFRRALGPWTRASGGLQLDLYGCSTGSDTPGPGHVGYLLLEKTATEAHKVASAAKTTIARAPICGLFAQQVDRQGELPAYSPVLSVGHDGAATQPRDPRCQAQMWTGPAIAAALRWSPALPADCWERLNGADERWVDLSAAALEGVRPLAAWADLPALTGCAVDGVDYAAVRLPSGLAGLQLRPGECEP